MTETQVVKLVKEWKDEMKGVVADYNSMLSKLDQTITTVKESEKKWWVVYKSHITVGSLTILLLGTIYFGSMIMKETDLCVVNVNSDGKGFTLQSCANIKTDPKSQ